MRNRYVKKCIYDTEVCNERKFIFAITRFKQRIEHLVVNNDFPVKTHLCV